MGAQRSRTNPRPPRFREEFLCSDYSAIIGEKRGTKTIRRNRINRLMEKTVKILSII